MCFLAFGCQKDPEPLTSNSVVTGFAFLRESPGSSMVEVVAKGPYGKKSAITDDDRFQITNLPNGTYELEYFKEGYGRVLQRSIQLFGNDTAYVDAVVLFTLPAKSIMPEFTACYWHENNLLISTNYNVENSFWPVRLYFSRDKNVSYENFESTLATTANYINEIVVYKGELSFPDSAKVYVIGYVCNTLDFGYFDTYTGKRVFSTLLKDHHSNTMSFQMQ